MTDPIRDAFTSTVTLDAAPSRVFAAFAEPELRRRWFRQPGDRSRQEYRLDFRVGGSETATTGFAPARPEESVEYASTFLDVVTDERIVLAYTVRLEWRAPAVGAATIMLAPEDDGTRVEWTEQYTFFALSEIQRTDVAHLQGSTRLQLNGLAAVLAT